MSFPHSISLTFSKSKPFTKQSRVTKLYKTDHVKLGPFTHVFLPLKNFLNNAIIIATNLNIQFPIACKFTLRNPSTQNIFHEVYWPIYYQIIHRVMKSMLWNLKKLRLFTTNVIEKVCANYNFSRFCRLGAK